MNVKNRGCIRNLSRKQLKAAKTRNLIAIVAIALTTLLFTSLFTVTMSINSSYQEYNLRALGGYAHGSFKEVNEEQIATLSAHKKIKEHGLRTVCGFATQVPFAKVPAEISWMEPNMAKWTYSTPTTGRMPEAANEIAMDTEALRKLGVPAELGQKVTLIYSPGTELSGMDASQCDEFILVGFWEHDELVPVHFINVSQDYVKQVEENFVAGGGKAFRTDLYVMLASSVNIDGVLKSIEEDVGFQYKDPDQDNYVRIGVSTGYTASELNDHFDPTTILAIVLFLVLVVFTGYLIIYNIFQISVSNDIRFYGLLKTIGTTPRQLKRIVRQQAMYLSLIGIPLGCILGYGVGALLMPAILSTTTISTVKVSASPLIFIGAALFAFITVRLSCARPAKKAANIPPVEAVRYTEVVTGRKKKRATRGANVRQMAFANLGRNKTKTTLVILSLSLAVVLLNCVFMFVGGFDMEKYLARYAPADFIIGTPAYFRFQGSGKDGALPEGVIEEIQANTQSSLEGSAYSVVGAFPKAWMTKEELPSITGPISDAMVQQFEEGALKRGDKLGVYATLQGLDQSLAEKIKVYEGSLEPLFDPSQHAIALGAKERADGTLYSIPYQVGDTLTLTYVEEWSYLDKRTGESATEDTPAEYLKGQIGKSHDVTYTVCALVDIPYNMGHRFSMLFGFDALVSGETLRNDSGMPVLTMYYAFDTPDKAAEAEAEKFLAAYTDGENSPIMYESKELHRKEFQNFQSMFLLVGTALCVIVGLVGILNFFNAILTGILTRHREFAMLQSVGMTGKQLKQMLILEGIFYAAGAGLVTLALSLILNPLVGSLLTNMFWFFTYRFTITPVLVVVPIFLALGVLLPLVIYKFTAKKSIVERLRETE